MKTSAHISGGTLLSNSKLLMSVVFSMASVFGVECLAQGRQEMFSTTSHVVDGKRLTKLNGTYTWLSHETVSSFQFARYLSGISRELEQAEQRGQEAANQIVKSLGSNSNRLSERAIESRAKRLQKLAFKNAPSEEETANNIKGNVEAIKELWLSGFLKAWPQYKKPIKEGFQYINTMKNRSDMNLVRVGNQFKYVGVEELEQLRKFHEG
jgi:hypothetical protein